MAKLTRARNNVRGTYKYDSIGVPITIEGTIEPSGAMALTETVNGKATGTLRLQPTGPDLAGEWTDVTGKKVFPLHLAPSAPSRPPSLVEQAQACLEDLACPASEVARLFVAAGDAKEVGVDCRRFLSGAGVSRDPARARTCLERDAITPCDGDSATLSRAELATMRIDGVGGPVDIADARKLFATCFDDVTKEAVLAHAAAKEHDPKALALDFCEKGGTTIVSEECASRRRDDEATRGLLAAKKIAATLDADGKRLLEAANKAFAAYARARVLYVVEVYNGGSMRTMLATNEDRILQKQRADDLEAFAAFKAKATTAEDVARDEGGRLGPRRAGARSARGEARARGDGQDVEDLPRRGARPLRPRARRRARPRRGPPRRDGAPLGAPREDDGAAGALRRRAQSELVSLLGAGVAAGVGRVGRGGAA
ncbi:hypothetical protein WME89_18210 [Sorangium sp. So ce321]|uniref:hypothetical protein n=1 Tax=Sorangium sp. So ce321 TaxID=3133300 RepID=UPI003F639851